MVDQGSRQTRDEKLENLMMNHSMILTGMFEEAFSALADKLAKASAGGADLGSTASREFPPDALTQIGQLVSEIREEVASQLPKNPHVFAHYVSSRAFDRGIKVVEKYDFGRPKITEKLTDGVLASYVFLLLSGDKELGKMFEELKAWQSGLPEPPWAG